MLQYYTSKHKIRQQEQLCLAMELYIDLLKTMSFQSLKSHCCRLEQYYAIFLVFLQLMD